MSKLNEKELNNIANAMYNAGYDVTSTASRLNCSSASVKYWIIGQKTPSAESIIKMAILFNCTTDYMLGISECIEELKVEGSKIDILSALTSMGTRIENAKDKCKYSYSELARQLNVKPCTVHNWINKFRIPNCDFIVKIARVLNVSTDYLFGLTDTDIQKQSNLDSCIRASRELTEQKGKTISYGQAMALKDGYYNVCKKRNEK